MRALADQHHLLEVHSRMMERQVAQLLLEALRPVALAMQRQDSLLELRADGLEQRLETDQKELTELLMEVLRTLQPPVEQQLGLAPSRPLPSSLASAISRTP